MGGENERVAELIIRSRRVYYLSKAIANLQNQQARLEQQLRKESQAIFNIHEAEEKEKMVQYVG